MEQGSNQERNEVFERIPWEMLEPKRTDRQWLVLGLAGAVVAGVLAYSVVGNRAAPATAPVGPQPAANVATEQVADPVMPPAPVAPPTAGAPVVTAEADLYAIHPERVVDRVVAHAEWFVAEYLTVDGSQQSADVLTALLPAGLPLPEPPEGARVFVEWVRASTVEEIAPLRYRVLVLARTLAAQGDEPYQRQAPLELGVVVDFSDEAPVVTGPPTVRPVPLPSAVAMTLSEVPADTEQAALALVGSGRVLGGTPGADGSWEVVVMAPAPDGVSRPQTVTVP